LLQEQFSSYESVRPTSAKAVLPCQHTAMSSFHKTASGTCVHYIQSGTETGPLILLLHGLGGSTRTFEPLLPFLPADYHIVNIDLEGFGKTALNKTQSTISVGRHVADLGDVISHLQRHSCTASNSTQPIVLIGHSLGSIIAVQYAARHPKAVSGLGLLGVGKSAAHIPAARERMLGLAKRTRAEGIDVAADIAKSSNVPAGADSDSARNEVRAAVAASDAEGYARTCEAMVSADHKDPDYSQITVPVVFVSGEDDIISPPARAEEIGKLLGGPKGLFVVHGGHQPILSDLAGTRTAMVRLFELVGSGRKDAAR
jgi:3-oxoadipate enol-lactonase